jgi:outer membrane protein assembly factor BamB
MQLPKCYGAYKESKLINRVLEFDKSIFPIYLLKKKSKNKNLILFQKTDQKKDLIFLNTLDGYLYAVSRNDGKIKWVIKEEAVLKFPKNYEK